MSDVGSVMDSIAKEELVCLTVRPFDELINLPPYTTKQIARDGHDLTVTVYHDSIVPTEHQIVVQVISRGWLGLFARS